MAYGSYYSYKNCLFRKGFIFKRFPFKQIQTDNIRPTFEEIQSFAKALKNNENVTSDDEENFNVEEVIKKLVAGGGSVDIAKGDKIRVVKGEL